MLLLPCKGHVDLEPRNEWHRHGASDHLSEIADEMVDSLEGSRIHLRVSFRGPWHGIGGQRVRLCSQLRSHS